MLHSLAMLIIGNLWHDVREQHCHLQFGLGRSFCGSLVATSSSQIEELNIRDILVRPNMGHFFLFYSSDSKKVTETMQMLQVNYWALLDRPTPWHLFY